MRPVMTRKSHPCYVCGDPKAAYHYGSHCCSGCKGFFRRSIRYQRKYICRNDNRCIISAERRNCCRACRLAKCFQVKMNPSMIQGEHGGERFSNDSSPPECCPDDSCYQIKTEIKDEYPNSVTKWKTEYEGPVHEQKYSSSIVTKSDRHYLLEEEYRKWHQLALNIRLSSTDLKDNPLSKMRIVPQMDRVNALSIAKYFVLVERLCDNYYDTNANHMFSPETEYFCSTTIPAKNAFFQPRSISCRTPIDWSARYFVNLSGMKRMWCRIVAHYSDWVSHIPEFSKLSEQDQLKLVIDRTTACGDIMTAYKSFRNNVNGLLLSGGSYFPRDEMEQTMCEPGVVPHMKKLTEWLVDEFVTPARNLQLTETEYALLRILTFFMPVDGLSKQGKQIVRKAANFYRNILCQQIKHEFPNYDSELVMDRLSKLMALLPVLENAKSISNATFSVMSLFNIANLGGELTYDVHVRNGLS